ncbi:MAG: hypothetical protein GC183_05360 [Thiobacillus sp.]|nr:hypothetical protein [Thiobacillus sp.]
MSAPKKLRSVIAALLLAPSLAAAADVEIAVSNEQPIPDQVTSAMKPDMVPPVLMWPPMMPAARPMVYYWAPPPGMMWPVLPQYPAPMPMPAVVWVMVPVPATSLTPAAVDYGPVADTPVVELPPVYGAPEAMMLEGGASPAPAMVDYGPVADTPVMELPQSEPDIAQAVAEDAALAAALAQEGKVNAGPAEIVFGVESVTVNGQASVAGEPATPTVAVPVNEIPVDYGSVAPTPVVDLLALESQASKAPGASQPPSKPARKPGTPVSPKPVAKTKSEPSKRLCWTKGVVAPCR